MMNPLLPQADAAFAMHDSAHQQLRAKYDKLTTASRMLDRARLEMDHLVKLADMVTPEDVVDAAGQLVAAGLEPIAMASLLADMPSTGGAEALAGWVQQQEQGLQQREMQLLQVRSAVQHQMGVAAMRSVMAHTVGEAVGGGQAPEDQGMAPQGPAAPPGPTNDLMGGGDQAAAPQGAPQGPLGNG